MARKPVLILGGGLAGLSAAYHLKKQNRPSVVVERENEVGGTARSFKIGGFTFDFTGHLLHLHTPYTRKLITRLLGTNFYRCQRKAWIFSYGTYTRYPFQANTFGLPQNVVDDCVVGFMENYFEKKNRTETPPDTSRMRFDEWCQRAFGRGISRHFMLPYNQKLYQVPASQMTSEWCGPFVPTPKLEEVIRGATGVQEKSFGYNTTFLYPKTGGIQVLARGLAQNAGDLRLNTTISSLDWKKKKASLSNGTVVSYDSFINTVPLPELLRLMKPLPAKIEKARRSLKFASVLCINIGVKRPRISEKSWVYFPEKKYPFYRVGFPMNFTPHAVPRGCSSMYVEVPLGTKKGFNAKKIFKRVRAGLIEAGILKSSDKLPVVQFLPIRYAYVIYNSQRQIALREIFPFLNKNRIQSIGRYGAWKYSFMEEAILDGKKAADAR